MTSDCVFECGNQSETLITSGATRIRSIIAARHYWGDNLHEELQVHLDEDFTTECHKSCVSSHTSRTHIQRQVVGVKQRLKREPPPRRDYAIQSYLCLFLNCTSYSVEKHVVSNLTHATHPGGKLHIFIKHQAMALDCHSKIQSLKSVVNGKKHGQTKLK